jgi:hypothetical protein
MHARLAAKHLRIDTLPLLITPHPLNDLTPEQVRDMARVAYPTIVKQLTAGEPEASTKIAYVHPAGLRRAPKNGSEAR